MMTPVELMIRRVLVEATEAGVSMSISKAGRVARRRLNEEAVAIDSDGDLVRVLDHTPNNRHNIEWLNPTLAAVIANEVAASIPEKRLTAVAAYLDQHPTVSGKRVAAALQIARESADEAIDELVRRGRLRLAKGRDRFVAA